MMRSLLLGSWSCFACWVRAGCGTVPPPPLVDAGPRDAAQRDANRDTGSTDDADLDGNVALTDSGIAVGSCRFVVAEDMAELGADPRSRTATIGVVGGPDGFAVTFSALGADAFENVYFAQVPSSGKLLVAPAQLTTDFATATAPWVSRTPSGWLVTWSSNRDATYDIYTQGFEPGGRPLPPARLTMDGLIQERPMLGRSGAATLLAWDEIDATVTVHTTVLRTLADDGSGAGAEQRLSAGTFSPTPQVIASTDDGFLMGWGDATGDAMVMPLETTGAAAGPPAGLSALDDNDGTIDLAMSFGGGAAVYGARIPPGRSEVHAHLIDGAGAPADVERALTVGPDSGTDASITEFAGGYAISYRQAGPAPVLRVLFVDASLNEVARTDVVPISLLGGRTTIRASGDGSLLVGWADIVDGATQVRAARIRCN